MLARSVLLFLPAALAEISGAWLIWQGWREYRGLLWIAASVIALSAYGFVAIFQHNPNFGCILAAHGGIFFAGSLAWSVLADRFDLTVGTTSALACACSVSSSSCTPTPLTR